MHSRIQACIWFHGKIYFCSLSQVPCCTPCFQADMTQNLARMDRTSLIEMEPTFVTSSIICARGSLSSQTMISFAENCWQNQILSSWRNDKRNGTNAIRRFNPDCSSTVQRFSDSLVLGFLTAMSFWCTELLGMIGSLPIFIPIVITKGQQLQWSRVKITYLEDIPNKVGIVSSKRWPSSLLSVVL